MITLMLHSMKNGEILLMPANLITAELAESLFTAQGELEKLESVQ